MPISFRYDAAAVVPPSNQTTRKYGQNLVLQQQQQKYNERQAGYERLFTLGRDQQQATRQAIMQGQQNAANTIRDVNQNANLVERQEAQNKFLTDQQQREQKAADFKAAQDRLSVYANDALKNPDTPPEVRQKIRDLMAGKTVAMGSGVDESQRQEFLRDYNAQLAGHLSQIPPPKPKAPPQPNFHTDENGNRWVEEGPGKWKKEEKPATSAAEAFAADPKVQKDYMEQAIKIEAKGGELDEAGYNRAVETARRLWERSNSPTEMRTIQPATVTPPQASPDTERSILETPAAPPAAAQAPTRAPLEPWDGTAPVFELPPERSILETQSAPQELAVQPPDPGVPPATGSQPTQSQATWDAIQQAQAKWNSAHGAGQGQDPQAAFGLNPEQQARASLIEGLKGQEQPAAGAGQSPIGGGMALAPGHPDYKPMPTPTNKRDDKGYVIMSDGSKVDPRDSDAMKSGGRQVQGIMRNFHPDGSPIERSTSNLVTQYEGAAQTFQGLQAKVATLDQKIQATSGSRIASNNPDVLANLKKQREQVNAELKKTQSAMQEADKSLRSYHDQQVAQQPAAQKLAKAGKRPQDFAEAEFQLQNLRKQYPEMASMPADAKKKLKEAMAIIQAGR